MGYRVFLCCGSLTLPLLWFSDACTRMLLQGHVMIKGDETSKVVMNDIEALLHHPDRNVREAAVDAIVQVRACLY
jgi:predicted transcriptional regulator